ncbi:uncharacterized protein B0H64DRAFT_445300 [Chaetomium fimeti]|uniref:PARP catalytic domain-containing protein n=1 Tax=Chaetomium fimeti TaxID=1854472 RepID=A0AAE0H9D1_9PEZI|nr:hypothetical protein B0H64DRAFT_445300 [Chaetomium fimeti]
MVFRTLLGLGVVLVEEVLESLATSIDLAEEATETHYEMDPPMKQLAPGSSEYRLYEKRFNDGWIDGDKSASVTQIYITGKDDLLNSARGQQFGRAMRQEGGGGFGTRFHGTQRACYIGENGGRLFTCDKPECYLCRVLGESFRTEYARSPNSPIGPLFGPGIYSSVASSKADCYARNHKIHSKKHVVLICRVITNRPQMLAYPDTTRTGPDHGFNCVEAVLKPQGGSVNYPETVVYRNDYIVPVGLIIYTREGWSSRT